MKSTRSISEDVAQKVNYTNWTKRITWWFVWILIIMNGCSAEQQKARKLYQVTDAQPEGRPVAFSPDNQAFAFKTVDHQIQVRNLSNNRVLLSLPYTDENPPVNLTFSPDSKQLGVFNK